VDGRIPEGWVVAHHVVHGTSHVTQIGYPEWANDPFYYEHLVDGVSHIVEEFRRHREELDRALEP
jgi:hypothetical protein